MDLNKLLENKKCMVLLGMGSWTCEEVSTFMDEVYDQHPEVQMIKYLGADMSSKFLMCGPIKEGLEPLKNKQGSFSIPIVCFLEQMNLEQQEYAEMRGEAREEIAESRSVSEEWRRSSRVGAFCARLAARAGSKRRRLGRGALSTGALPSSMAV